MAEPSNEFAEYRRLILATLERLDQQIDTLQSTAATLDKRLSMVEGDDASNGVKELRDQLNDTQREMASLKTTVAWISAAAAAGVTALAQAGLHFIGRGGSH